MKKALKNNFYNLFVSFFIVLLYNILIVRYFTPSDLGLISIYSSIYFISILLFSSGISSTIINFDNSSGVIFHFFVKLLKKILIIISLLVTIFIILTFKNLTFNLFIFILFYTAFSFKIIAVPFEAILQKNMLFRELRIANIISNFVSVLIPIILIYFNFNFVSLAIHFLILSISNFLIIFFFYIKLLKRTLTSKNSKQNTKIIFGFFNFSYFTSLIYYFLRYIDNIFIGIFWNNFTVGLYSRNYIFIKNPIDFFTGIIRPIIHPLLKSNFNQNISKLYFELSITFSIVAVLFSGFINLFLDDLIILLLGENWLEIKSIIIVLSFTIWSQFQTSIVSAFYYYFNDSKTPFIISLIKLFSLVFIFLITGFINNFLFLLISISVHFTFIYFLYIRKLYSYFNEKIKTQFLLFLSFFGFNTISILTNFLLNRDYQNPIIYKLILFSIVLFLLIITFILKRKKLNEIIDKYET